VDPVTLAWVSLALSIIGLGLAGYETWADVERERVILEQLRTVHGQQTELSPMRQEAWGALLSGQPIDARLLGIGGL
jgi:hypothetical protein